MKLIVMKIGFEFLLCSLIIKKRKQQHNIDSNRIKKNIKVKKNTIHIL